MRGRAGRGTRSGLVALAAAGSVLLGGCSFGGFHGIDNVTLPGGANLGSHPYHVTAQFTDVLDLVPQAAVKVDNVPVGRVGTVSLSHDGTVADVSLAINGDTQLPANATASIEQSSLLGEKYVELETPTAVAPQGQLTNGDTIPVSDTSAGVQLEQVFGALSLLLNGGGLGQLRTITTELNKALGGRENSARAFLQSLNVVVGRLNTHRASIVSALNGLDELSTKLRENTSELKVALAHFSPGLRILAQQRKQLVTMLTSLNRLSTVTVRTLNASQANTVADLRQLAPTLHQLAAAGSALPNSLQVLLTYPFPDSVLGAIRGDYLNAFITTNLNTPGGTVVQGLTASSVRGHTSGAHTIASPSLLPATSSAAAGLPMSQITTPAGGG